MEIVEADERLQTRLYDLIFKMFSPHQLQQTDRGLGLVWTPVHRAESLLGSFVTVFYFRVFRRSSVDHTRAVPADRTRSPQNPEGK